MDPHTRKHHYAQGLIHPVIRDLIRDAVRPTFGFGGAVSTISWLLSNNLNLTATIGASATNNSTSVTQARVFDATSGLLIEEVPAGNAVSEFQRISYDTDEGATLGGDSITNGSFTAWTADDPDDWSVFVEDANNYLTEDVNGARLVSDGGGSSTVQAGTMTVGATIKYTLVIPETTGAGIKFSSSSESLAFSTVDTHIGTFVATGTDFGFLRSGATNTVIGSISLEEITPVWLNSVSSADATLLHPTHLGDSGETIFEVMGAWPGATQVVAQDTYAVGTNGNHNYYYKATTGGTTGGTEPTWPTSSTVADGSVVWTFQGRYSNAGAGYLPHVLNEPVAVNVVLQTKDPDNAAWTQAGTFAAVQDLTGYDNVANSGWTFSGLDTPTVGDIGQVVSGLTTSTRYEPSVYLKQISTVGVIRFASAVSAANGQWNIDLSKLSTNWQTVDRNHPAVTVVTEFTTGGGTTCGPYFAKQSGTGTLSVGYFDTQLELGTVSTSIIPTTTGSVQRNATRFTVANPLPQLGFQTRGRAINNGNAVSWIINDTYDGSNSLYLASSATSFAIVLEAIGVQKVATANIPAGKQAVGSVYNWGVSVAEDGTLTVAVDGVAGTPVAGAGSRILGTAMDIGSRLLDDTFHNDATDNTINTDMTDPDWYKDTTWSDPS